MGRAIVICGNRDLVGGSRAARCERCEAPVVVSPGTEADAGSDAELVCLKCGAGVIANAEAYFGGVGPNQAPELGALKRPSRP